MKYFCSSRFIRDEWSPRQFLQTFGRSGRLSFSVRITSPHLRQEVHRSLTPHQGWQFWEDSDKWMILFEEPNDEDGEGEKQNDRKRTNSVTSCASVTDFSSILTKTTTRKQKMCSLSLNPSIRIGYLSEGEDENKN